MTHESPHTSKDNDPLPLHELLSQLLLPKMQHSTSCIQWIPMAGTLQTLNQQLVNQPFLDFLNYNLRGIGQVIFVNNPISGLLILIALFIQSPWVGVMSVVGVMASTLTAILLKLDRTSLRNGIFGYNGILVGAAIATFGSSGNGNWNPLWVVATALFSALTTVFINTAGVWFASKLKFPPLTLPFIVGTLLFLALATWIPQPVFKLEIASPALPPAPLDWLRLAAALPIGFGQVFLMDQFLPGVLVLLAVGLCTPMGAAIGLLGGLLGILAGFVFGASTPAIYAGLWSYNAVLTAMAIAGVFYAPNLRSIGVGGGAALVSALLGGLLGIGFSQVGLPILTLSFCIVTIIGFLVLRRSLPSLVPVALHAISSPEEHRQRFVVAKEIITTFRRQLKDAMAGTPRRHLLESASDATQKDLKYLFNAIDTNFSETISVEELADHLRHLKRPLSEEELVYLFKSLDIDQNGEIDFAEFGELMLRQQRLMANYPEFVTYFLPIDANEDDAISIDEMNVAIASVGELPLSKDEISFLQIRMGNQPLSWNRFIEMLLVT
ncbi:MAG: urea transporter [Leptolyngbyaceae bacterium]|nr:urea transporter [Leptolyngbyaceae bacterium]